MEQSLTNMRYVRTLLERHGFHFSKKLGQNFLINPDVCPRIAEMGMPSRNMAFWKLERESEH